MKPKGSNARNTGASTSLPPSLPIAWMDPMSWRLPSGQALAEFALQSGFLAPLLLSGPSVKRKRVAPIQVPLKSVDTVEKRMGERPDAGGSFRHTR
jgi:hypothetical protein